MKKILLLAAVAGLMAVTCKKDYTCECTTTMTTPSGTTTTTAEGKTGKMKKADAEKKCDESDASASSGPYSTVVECKIK
ncbi:MAG: hypothetical protein JNL60_02620 [Bacteroidia bacterium]|nr:hypothetical protein [Bacteroidia bacterium]